MKKTILLLMAVLELFASCRKDSPSPYFLKADIGGTSTTFNAFLTANKIFYAGKIFMISLSGAKGTGTTAPYVQIDFDNKGPGLLDSTFKTGTYSDTSTVFGLAAFYDPNGLSANPYIASNYLAGQADSMGIVLRHHLNVVLTALDDTHIAGTFSGDFFQNQDPTTTPVTVTDGSFNVKFSN